MARGTTVVRAGLAYAGLVFAAGFVLGTVRVLALAPAVGPLAAVALELPVMLALSWIAARIVLARLPVPARPGPRLAMGAVALAALLGAEAALGVLGFGQSLAAWAAGLVTPEGMLGLAGQGLFALLPRLMIGRG
jgi:hypothetical protein